MHVLVEGGGTNFHVVKPLLKAESQHSIGGFGSHLAVGCFIEELLNAVQVGYRLLRGDGFVGDHRRKQRDQ